MAMRKFSRKDKAIYKGRKVVVTSVDGANEAGALYYNIREQRSKKPFASVRCDYLEKC